MFPLLWYFIPSDSIILLGGRVEAFCDRKASILACGDICVGTLLYLYVDRIELECFIKFCSCR